MSKNNGTSALAERPATMMDTVYSPEVMVQQVEMIQKMMLAVMRKDEHYGVIPGTQKPTLLKSGAEKLCMAFRLDPQYRVIESIREDRFISYMVEVILYHIPTAQRIASGIGSCNSREAKYRWRLVSSESRPSKEEGVRLKAAGLGQWKKQYDGSFQWFDRVEHDNPWDFDNTILKMASKRAMVAATLNATAASDIFAQDLEDLPPELRSEKDPQPQDEPQQKTAPLAKLRSEISLARTVEEVMRISDSWENAKGTLESVIYNTGKTDIDGALSRMGLDTSTGEVQATEVYEGEEPCPLQIGQTVPKWYWRLSSDKKSQYRPKGSNIAKNEAGVWTVQ
jgi:hypothetical protein